MLRRGNRVSCGQMYEYLNDWEFNEWEDDLTYDKSCTTYTGTCEAQEWPRSSPLDYLPHERHVGALGNRKQRIPNMMNSTRIDLHNRGYVNDRNLSARYPVHFVKRAINAADHHRLTFMKTFDDSVMKSNDTGPFKRSSVVDLSEGVWKDENTPDESEREDVTDMKNDGKEQQENTQDTDITEMESMYNGIPSDLFVCHLCNKCVCNSNLFTQHLNSESHQQKLITQEKNYREKADMIRHELQVQQQRREIEMKKKGMHIQLNDYEYCSMCRIRCYGNIVVHRRSDSHQKLKEFLHPQCKYCQLNFTTRIQWDSHILSPEHLRNIARQLNYPDSEFQTPQEDEFVTNDVNVKLEKRNTTNMVSFNVLDEEEKVETEPLEFEEMTQDELDELEENKELKNNECDEQNKKGDSPQENNIEFEATDDRFPFPKYKSDCDWAVFLIKETSGYLCRGCQRFFLTESEKQAHCRSETHFNVFLSLLKRRVRHISQNVIIQKSPKKRKYFLETKDTSSCKYQKGDNL